MYQQTLVFSQNYAGASESEIPFQSPKLFIDLKHQERASAMMNQRLELSGSPIFLPWGIE